MAYGAQAKRVDAKITSLVADVDLYKIGLLGKTERGISGIIKEINSFGMYEKMCGSYQSGNMTAYVAKTFFDTLKSGVQVEMKVATHVASDAVQAFYNAENTSNDCLALKAACLGKADKSAYGNRINFKITKTEEFQYKLSAEIAITGTSATLVSVEGLAVGQFVRIDNTTVNETKKILTLNSNTKTITFSALANVAAMSVATTTVYRQDIKLEVGLADVNGFVNLVETWERMAWTTDAINIINTTRDNSYWLLASAIAFVEVDAAAIPKNVTTWTPLATGVDGTTSTDVQMEAIADLYDDEDISILISPAFTTTAYNLYLADKASENCDYIYYVNIPENATEATLKALGATLRKTYQFGIIPMDKWFEMYDPLNPSLVINVPNIGILAAHYFNEYSANGVGRVAAGNRTPINTILIPDDDNGLIHDDKAGTGDMLIRNYSVNIGRFKSGVGTTINSARTLATDKGYCFQNQIMGFLLIKKSIYAYLQSIEQDSSGVDAQELHYNAIWTYCKKKYDSNVFYKGQKEDGTKTEMKDVVTIVNDFSINTLTDIANGKETNFLQVVFVPPIEEPILDLASAPVTSI